MVLLLGKCGDIVDKSSKHQIGEKNEVTRMARLSSFLDPKVHHFEATIAQEGEQGEGTGDEVDTNNPSEVVDNTR